VALVAIEGTGSCGAAIALKVTSPGVSASNSSLSAQGDLALWQFWSIRQECENAGVILKMFAQCVGCEPIVFG
jgi:hypothetical protein